MEEAIFSAGAAAFVYLYAMAYQYGYQEPFGFLYLSLGPEKIVETMRPVLLYFVAAGAVALVAGSLMRVLLGRRFGFRVITFGFLVLPVIIWVVLIWFIRVDRSQLGDVVILTILYVLVDRLVLEGIGALLSYHTQPITQPVFRYFQIALAGLMLIIVGYDQGKFDALHMAEADLCPPIGNDKTDRILVQETADTMVCVAIDRHTASVFREITYFKLPDDGTPKVFKTIPFHPVRFGEMR